MNYDMVISGMTMGAPTGLWDSYNISDYQHNIKRKIQQTSNIYNNQTLSLLFNSFTEQKHGEIVSSTDLGFNNLYADSGGIQMITSKKGITEELKDRVYRHQAKYSTYAFVFDEIPIYIDKKVNNGMNVLNNTSGKYYVKEMIVPSAKQTSLNIKRQVQLIDEVESETKIFIISQGDIIDNINLYIDTIMEELTDYEMSKVHGLALSTACVGTDLTSRFDVLYAYNHINVPDRIKKNIHLLGVGNVTSLFPVAYNDSYFKNIINISYDSTRQTNSYLFKKYTDSNHITYKLNNNRKDVHICMREIYERNHKEFNDIHIKSYLDLIENLTKYSSLNKNNICKFYNKDFINVEQSYKYVHFYWVMEVIVNFMKQIDDIKNKRYNNYLKKNSSLFLMNKINDYQDYIEWKKQTSYIQNRVKIINKKNDIIKQNKLEEWIYE